jgi:signal transduction histidine kinase
VTLAFAFGAILVVSASLALLYTVLVGQLDTALDAGLAARGDDVAAAVRAGDTSVLESDPLAQLYGPDGNPLAGSPSLGERDPLLTPSQVRAVTAPVTTTVSLPVTSSGPAVPVRLLSQRVEPGGPVVAVGVSTQPIQAARQRLLTVLLVVAPLLVAALAAAAWLLVGAALRRVDALTRTAMKISSLELAEDSRLPAVAGDDEIARLARTLDAMLARLRAAFTRERAFVDDASHELRTPIAILRGEIELALSATDDPAEVRRSLHNALAEAERLTRLAEDLLLLARAQAGNLVTQREPVDLLDLARTEAQRLSTVLGLRVEATGDPVVIQADPARLRQAFANLAGNSAAAGARRQTIRIAHQPGAATIEVADDGPGFPTDILDHAFERFVRGDAATRGPTGAGLGLPIVQAVATAHDGTASVRNNGPLGGTVITIRLPLR